MEHLILAFNPGAPNTFHNVLAEEDEEQEQFMKEISALFQNRGEHTADSSTYKVVVSSARLRTGAGTNYEILNSYENGTEVTITGKKQSDGNNIWYEVVAPDGTIGWMRDDMIRR